MQSGNEELHFHAPTPVSKISVLLMRDSSHRQRHRGKQTTRELLKAQAYHRPGVNNFQAFLFTAPSSPEAPQTETPEDADLLVELGNQIAMHLV